MRLIDADAMLETLKRKYPQWYTGKPKDSWMHYVCLVYYWAVREAPTIDAVPVEEIAGIFGNPPCLYTFDCLEVQGDEFMYDHRWEWCEKNCMHVPCVDCWKQFFEAWRERKEDD